MIDWLAIVQTEVVVDIGQLDQSTRRQLDSAARKGRIAKWRGHWAPIPGASFGHGPLKRCFGPVGSQECLP